MCQTPHYAFKLLMSTVTAAAGLDKQFAFNSNAAVGQSPVLDMLCFSDYTLVIHSGVLYICWKNLYGAWWLLLSHMSPTDCCCDCANGLLVVAAAISKSGFSAVGFMSAVEQSLPTDSLWCFQSLSFQRQYYIYVGAQAVLWSDC